MVPILAVAALAAPPLDAVVFVEQGSSSCAGARLDDAGTVLTAYHCVASGGRPRVRSRDGTSVVARVRAVDRLRDLAVLDAPGLPGSWIELGETPDPGDPVSVVGHPLGASPPAGFLEGTLRWSVAHGEVSAVGVRAVQITAPVNPGNSGGPVLDGSGALIGVVSRRLSGDGLGFAGRTDGVSELLARPARRLDPFGGSVSLEVMIQANGQFAVPVSVGGRLEVAMRDRVVLAGSAALPVGARWEAVTAGSASHEPLEGRIGLRQRFARGPWTVRLDGWAGVGAVETLDADGIELSRTQSTRVLVGGRLAARGIALDMGFALGDQPFTRMQVHLRWPGTLFVL